MAHAPLSIETVDSRVLMLAMEDIVWQDVAEYFPSSGDSAPARGINMVEFSGDSPEALETRVAAFVAHLARDAGAARSGHTICRRPCRRDPGLMPCASARWACWAMCRARRGRSPSWKTPPCRPETTRRLHRRVPRAARRPWPLVRHVRPRGRRRAARAARAGPQGPGPGRADPPALRRGGAAHRRSTAACSGASMARACRSSTHRASSARCMRRCRNSRPPSIRTTSSTPARSRRPRASMRRCCASTRCRCAPTPTAASTSACGRVRRRPALQRQRRLLRLRPRRGRMPLVEGHARAPPFAQGRALAAARMAAAAGRGRRRRAAGRGAAALVPGRAAARWRNPARRRSNGDDFSHEVYEAMAGCLGLQVLRGAMPGEGQRAGVPRALSRALPRALPAPAQGLLHRLASEYSMPGLARMPALYNGLMAAARGARPARAACRHGRCTAAEPLRFRRHPAALQRAPRHALGAGAAEAPTSALARWCRCRTPSRATSRRPCSRPSSRWRARLGCIVWLAPAQRQAAAGAGLPACLRPRGARNADMLDALAQCGVPLVGLDPAMTLVYRQEYAKPAADDCAPPCGAAAAGVAARCAARRSAAARHAGRLPPARALHREDQRARSAAAVARVFVRAGLRLEAQASGCCGMSGTYGHEQRNLQTSQRIFSQSWAPLLTAEPRRRSSSPPAVGAAAGRAAARAAPAPSGGGVPGAVVWRW